MRSSATLYARSHAQVCVRTHSRVFERIEPHCTHSLCARVHHTLCTVLLECDRAHSISGPSLDPFLGNFSFPHFISPHAIQLSLHSYPFFSHTPYTKPLKSSKPTTQILHRITIAPPRHRSSPPPVPFPHFTPISIFFLTQTQLLQIRFFLSIFLFSKGTNPSTGCAIFYFCVGFAYFFQGDVFDKIP
jgi:hypothetical protein